MKKPFIAQTGMKGDMKMDYSLKEVAGRIKDLREAKGLSESGK